MYFTASLRMPTMRWIAAWMVSRRRKHPAHRRSSLEAITPNAPITIGLPMALTNQGWERTCSSMTSGLLLPDIIGYPCIGIRPHLSGAEPGQPKLVLEAPQVHLPAL
jgi:hypothetical protein